MTGLLCAAAPAAATQSEIKTKIKVELCPVQFQCAKRKKIEPFAASK